MEDMQCCYRLQVMAVMKVWKNTVVIAWKRWFCTLHKHLQDEDVLDQINKVRLGAFQAPDTSLTNITEWRVLPSLFARPSELWCNPDRLVSALIKRHPVALPVWKEETLPQKPLHARQSPLNSVHMKPQHIIPPPVSSPAGLQKHQQAPCSALQKQHGYIYISIYLYIYRYIDIYLYIYIYRERF